MLLSSISANPLGSILKQNGSAINCAELHSRKRPYGRSHNESRIFRSITISNFDPLSDPSGQELLRQIGLDSQQKANAAPRLLFKQLGFDPPLDQPPSYQSRSVGFIPRGNYSDPIETPPWKGGGSTDQCMAGETNPGIPSSQELEHSSKWDQLRYHYSPTSEELNRLYAQRAKAAPDVPLTVLLDDLNVEEAKIAYAKVGLEAVDRALENIDHFTSYVKHL
jgi:hypothetical protein